MIRKKYIRKEEIFQFHSRLKFMVCPFCGLIGALILHGYLRGYIKNKLSRRGIRIICNNRRKKKRKGCGKSFSYLYSFLIKGYNYTTEQLWHVALKISNSVTIKDAFFTSGFSCTLKTIYRVWKKFRLRQSAIRSALLSYTHRQLPNTVYPQALQETVTHLVLLFPQAFCPLEAFQHTCNVSIL